MEMRASGVERPDSGGPAGIEGDIAPERCLLPIKTPKPDASVSAMAAGMTRPQLPIEADKFEPLPIFPNQRALAGRKVKLKDIVPAPVAIVEIYRDLAGGNVRPKRRYRADVGKRCEIAEFATSGIDDEQVQIFVPVLIVEKHDVTAVRAPGLPGNRPALGARDRLTRRDAVCRRHPDVQDAIDRG
jgi:hypothetical protein